MLWVVNKHHSHWTIPEKNGNNSWGGGRGRGEGWWRIWSFQGGQGGVGRACRNSRGQFQKNGISRNDQEKSHVKFLQVLFSCTGILKTRGITQYCRISTGETLFSQDWIFKGVDTFVTKLKHWTVFFKKLSPQSYLFGFFLELAILLLKTLPLTMNTSLELFAFYFTLGNSRQNKDPPLEILQNCVISFGHFSWQYKT